MQRRKNLYIKLRGHNGPICLLVQMHENAPILFTHAASFWHGLLAHSSTSKILEVTKSAAN